MMVVTGLNRKTGKDLNARLLEMKILLNLMWKWN